MTRNTKISASIVDLFDNALAERGIEITCKSESDEKNRLSSKEDGNIVSIYGSEYWELVEHVEEILNSHDERMMIILHNILQELFDKTFDFNYDEFYSYITQEIGITEEEIDLLKANHMYISDINNIEIV